MWFTVLVLFICVLRSNVNSCPTLLNPCSTQNGTEGHCTQLKHCPPLNRIANHSDIIIQEFVTRSICGIDVDKSKLYCCDVSQLDVKPTTTPCPAQSEELPSSTVGSLLNLPSGNKVVNTFGNVINEGLNSSSCQTPNSDVAQCISLFKCPRLLAAAMNLNDRNSRRFLRESNCGYEDGTLFVCCGSAVNFKNADEARVSNFLANPLVPTEACGIEVSPTNDHNNKQERNLNISITNRIFGGINSEINEFPWVVLLQYKNVATNSRFFLCGGSLISSRYVLTAAHCVTANDGNELVAVRLGAWKKTSLEKSCVEQRNGRSCVNAAIDVGVEKAIAHPDYVPRTKKRYNDIALIRLDREVKFEANNHIYPICLPKFNHHIESGSRLTISGWGLKNYNEESEIKQKVEVPVIPLSQCSRMFLNNFVSSHHILNKGQFCAGGEPGKDACVGDSGAPAMTQLNSTQTGPRWYLTGIVSFGVGCGFTDRYGVYTKVSEYVNWIHENIVA